MNTYWLIAVFLQTGSALIVPDQPGRAPTLEHRAQIVASVTQTFPSKAGCEAGAAALRELAQAGDFLVLVKCQPLDVAKLIVTEPPRRWPDARAPR